MAIDSVVELRIVSTTLGLKVPKTSLGLNVLSGFYIQFRHNSVLNTYGVASSLNLDQGGFVFGSVATDWFSVRYSFSQDTAPDALEGKLADLVLDTGVVIGSLGSIDMSFTVYGDTNQPITSIDKIDIEAEGIMILDSKVRGKLVRIGEKNHSQK